MSSISNEMTEDERKTHAIRLLYEVLSDIEYDYVYEDETLEDASEEDWRAIHNLMSSATASFSWDV